MLRVLHTADWHIGQVFLGYDRTFEHQQFLDWLVQLISDEEVDVLLVSGDVFDQSNPSAASVKMFYSFLNNATKVRPSLQIIVTAGNHDSASRLEAPKPLLESTNVNIVGVVTKHADGTINYNDLLVPIYGDNNEIEAWCMAIPFLRIGDYPSMPDSEKPYIDGVAELYRIAFNNVNAEKNQHQAIIAMGHLHAQQVELGDTYDAERQILGGIECISASAFHQDISYVALGHIHKAQKIGGKEHIRYSGSPIPLSFSETNYKHQVIIFELDNKLISNLKAVDIPVTIPLLHVPTVHSVLPEVLNSLAQLPSSTAVNSVTAPYLEVRVLLNGPEPALRHKIESALHQKGVRLAKIDVRYLLASDTSEDMSTRMGELTDLQPADVFAKVYQQKYNSLLPAEMLQLFNQVAQEVEQYEQV